MENFSIELVLIINLGMVVILSFIGFIWTIKELHELHKSLNSRLDQLLLAAQVGGHAAGVAEERERHDPRQGGEC